MATLLQDGKVDILARARTPSLTKDRTTAEKILENPRGKSRNDLRTRINPSDRVPRTVSANACFFSISIFHRVASRRFRKPSDPLRANRFVPYKFVILKCFIGNNDKVLSPIFTARYPLGIDETDIYLYFTRSAY